MTSRLGACLAICGTAAVAHATVDLVGLALEGRWSRVLEEAARRQRQLPLRADDALVAAHAARVMGDLEREISFLEIATTGGDLIGVATVELASALLHLDTERALALARPQMRAAETPQLRDAALEVVTACLERGVGGAAREAVERELPSLDRDQRRRLELALAVSDGSVDGARRRLGKLLAASPRDRVALDAAERLGRFEELEDRERWWIARALYLHALYDHASPMLESVADVSDPRVPRWEVEFFRGRCAFRLGRFEEAAAWYARARSRVSVGERAADLEVHLGRALELAGDLDQAVEAARRAVLLRETDDRRLFLARLRLRRDELGLAELGVGRVRSRTARDRGYLLLGLEARSRGDAAAQREWMGRVTRDPWQQMAAVLMAQVDLDADDPVAALARLTASAPALEPFWALEARELLHEMPPDLVAAWRVDRVSRLDSAATATDRLRELAIWAALEPEPDQLTRMRARVAATVNGRDLDAPVFEDGLARRLWLLGLDDRAVIWDPAGLPHRDAGELEWTARQLHRLERWDAGIRAADRARAGAASMVPLRAHDEGVRSLMFPSPYLRELHAAVRGRAISPELVAAVAREESRWNPDVVSVVGARGLMQLMPETASDIAATLEAGTVRTDDLFDPAVALRFGAAELDRLLAAFGGFRPAAIAAYNAGEPQARVWLEGCGTGCDAATYVATISFQATRGYTADVLWAASVYRDLWAAAPVADVQVTARTR